MPIGRLWGRIKRASERRKMEIEKESKQFVVSKMTEARAIFFGLQNDKDLLPLPSKQKKGPTDAEVKAINKEIDDKIQAYMKTLSHPHYFARDMGLGDNIFPPPEGHEEKTSQEFREQRRKEVEAREKRFAAALRSIGEATSNQFPEG